MEMKKCEKGHYYDVSVHASCPYCRNANETEKTVAMLPPEIMAIANQNAANSQSGNDELTRSLSTPSAVPQTSNTVQEKNEVDNVPVLEKNTTNDPVVGWLVGTMGNDKGKDYRIHAENNYIGKSRRVDIVISGDEELEDDFKTVLTYDPEKNEFYLSIIEGRSILRRNGEAVVSKEKLRAFDMITIGKSDFVFVPLCGDKFEWN